VFYFLFLFAVISCEMGLGGNRATEGFCIRTVLEKVVCEKAWEYFF